MGAIGLAVAIFAFVLDFSGFLDNFFSEISGIPLGASIAILIIDHIVEADRKTQWELVKEKTERAVQSRLMAVVNFIYLEVGSNIDNQEGQLFVATYSQAVSHHDIEVIAKMAESIHDSAVALGSRESPESIINPTLGMTDSSIDVEHHSSKRKVGVSK